MDKIVELLFKNQDIVYGDFHSRLMPTIDRERVIGVRVPKLRSLAKELSKNEANEFLSMLPHYYYEENNLHAFLLQKENNFERCVQKIDEFLPFIDNWATCDMLRPRCFKGNEKRLYPYVIKWLNSDKIYTVRFAMGMLLSYYLDEHFSTEHLDLVSKVSLDDYYVKMMKAWYFSTALSKQYESAVKVLKRNILDKWTHNKTIQKAIESYRIDDNIKLELKSLRRK